MQTQRITLGIISLVMTVGGAALYFDWFSGFDGGQQAGGMFFKAGLGLFAIWLAMPQIADIFTRSNKTWFLIVGGVIAMAFFRNAIFIIAPVLIAVGVMQFVSYLFKPLPKKKEQGETK